MNHHRQTRHRRLALGRPNIQGDSVFYSVYYVDHYQNYHRRHRYCSGTSLRFGSYGSYFDASQYSAFIVKIPSACFVGHRMSLLTGLFERWGLCFL